MRILADENVPEEYVSALRGDGRDVVYSRAVVELGPEASDAELVRYAEREGFCLLSTDLSDFSRLEVDVPVFVAPQGMSGSDVRTAIDRVDTLPFDPSTSDPIWLSSL